MPLINLSMPRRRTLEEARGSPETAVHTVHSKGSAVLSPWGAGRAFSRLFSTHPPEAAELRG